MRIKLLHPEWDLIFNLGSSDNLDRHELVSPDAVADISFVLEDVFEDLGCATGYKVLLGAETSWDRDYFFRKDIVDFLGQFDLVAGPYDWYPCKFIRAAPFLPWMINSDFHENLYSSYQSFNAVREQLLSMGPFEDTENICVLCSAKNFTAEHRFRVNLIKDLVSTWPGIFHCYGSLWGRPVPRKADLFERYKNHLVIENKIGSHFVSEKLIDPLIAGCTVFYLGGDFCSSNVINMRHLSLDLERNGLDEMIGSRLGGINSRRIDLATLENWSLPNRICGLATLIQENIHEVSSGSNLKPKKRFKSRLRELSLIHRIGLKLDPMVEVSKGQL